MPGSVFAEGNKTDESESETVITEIEEETVTTEESVLTEENADVMLEGQSGDAGAVIDINGETIETDEADKTEKAIASDSDIIDSGT